MSSQNGSAAVPLAIVGIGCLFPRASNARAYWLNIKNGIDGIGSVPPTHWKPEDYLDPDPKSPDHTYAARGGFLEPVDFSPLEFGIAPNDLEATDTSQLLGLVAARQALRDAGYDADRQFDRNRVSVILGVTGTLELVIPLGARLGHPKWKKALANAGVPEQQAKQVIDEIGESYVGWQENSFPGLLGNVVAGRIANRLDLGGTNCVVDAACASSLSALHLASMELAAGKCDMAVTGGVDTFNDIFMFMCFSKTPALSPTGDAKPFDAKGDGTILGEGLGIVVLKRLADAERDGDRVYAVIRGLGSSSDGKGNAIYAPVAAGQVKALRKAYDVADITPDTIELVEAHGTGTRVGDGVEVTALTEVYREARLDGTWCALGSVKSQIGHTKAAAGAAGLIKAALALHHQVLPPTLKVQEPIDPLKNGPFYINIERRPWIATKEHPRRAAVSAFGFGGSNFHCVLEEHRSAKQWIDWDGDVEIIALSGPTDAELGKQLDEFKKSRDWIDTRRRAARLRQRFSALHDRRLLLVVNRETDLTKLAESAQSKLTAEQSATFWRLPEGAYFGAGPAAGKLAVLFPGQGSQYVGMMRDLACAFPVVRDVLADGNRVFARMAGNERGERLSDLIYPFSAFSKAEREQQDLRLRRTEVAQPAIGAVALGALKVFEEFGLQPDAYAGHSYGELPALCAAGCFDAEALHAISRLRGHLMASYHGGDAGCMLAVHAPLNAIESVLHEEDLELVIANRNAPAQSVLSGNREEIERAIACLDRRRLRHTRLPVAAAFHSPLVAAAREPFHDALTNVEFQSARSLVFANSTGDVYPPNPDSIRKLLAGQLANPVEFVREIGCMTEGGVRTFLEVGPGSTLTKLVHSIFHDGGSAVSGWDAFALDASTGKRSGMLDLAHALARLAARGHAVDLKPWQQDDELLQDAKPVKPGLLVPICGANYVSPKSKTPKKVTMVHSLSPASGERAGVRGQDFAPVQANHLPAKVSPPHPALSPEAGERVKTVAPLAMRPIPTSSNKVMQPNTMNSDSLTQALQITQQNLAAFQQLQEQTATLHRQFLENQEAAQRTLQMLLEQQHSLVLGGARPLTLPAVPRPTPAVIAPPRVVEKPAARNGHAASNGQHHAPSPPVAPKVVRPVADAPRPRVDVNGILFNVVAEKTGYPPEMLTPEMALDADLGIDSIKRVEIFAALQERLPEAPVVKPEHLGTLQTLGDVIAFLSGTAEPAAPRPVAPPVQRVEAESDDVSSVLFQVVAAKTGYPTEMLTAEMTLDADLGIDSIKRVEIFSALQERLPEAPIVKPEHLGTLHTLGDVATFLAGASIHPQETATPAKKKSAEVEAPGTPCVIERSILRAVPFSRSSSAKSIQLTANTAVTLVAETSLATSALSKRMEAAGHAVHLHSWDDLPKPLESSAAGLILIAPTEKIYDDLALRAFRWLRATGPKKAFIATVSQLDGAFGLTNLPIKRDACSGALAGLAKTASHEWPDVACKAIDVAPDFPPSRFAELWDEIQIAGPLEVGLSAKGAMAIELVQESSPGLGSPIAASDVVLVTGGARGVTAAVAQVIAENFQATLVLVGRTALGENEPDWLRACQSEAAIKQTLARKNPGSTPKSIDTEYRHIVAAREARSNIAAMTAAGSRVVYRQLDVTDPAAVKAVLHEIRATVGPIAHLIHGAGVLADRHIVEQTDEQFSQVYATKVIGIETLLRALEPQPLKSLVLFSSSTGRFGRTGQVAYAAANEALNKIAQREQRRQPDCKVVALNWGPWDGGMVTPALRKIFESEGIGTIPLREGAEFLLRELSAARSAVEVTVIAKPPVGIQSENQLLSQAFEQEISLDRYPILRSHVLDRRAVLPLALHLELLAHAGMHGNPGLLFHGINELRLLNGVQIDGDQAAHLKVAAGKATKRDSGFVVPVEITGIKGARPVVHARAEVLLASSLPAATEACRLPKLRPYPQTLKKAYQRILFHGSDLAKIERLDGMSDSAIAGWCRPAPLPAHWLSQPLRRTWIADPLLLDSAFQLMILWCHAKHGQGCLPCFVGGYRQYVRDFGVGLVQIHVRIKQEHASLVRADIEFVNEAGQLLAAMTDHESVLDAGLDRAFRNNRLAELASVGKGEDR